jgi:hypothetical protein
MTSQSVVVRAGGSSPVNMPAAPPTSSNSTSVWYENRSPSFFKARSTAVVFIAVLADHRQIGGELLVEYYIHIPTDSRIFVPSTLFWDQKSPIVGDRAAKIAGFPGSPVLADLASSQSIPILHL